MPILPGLSFSLYCFPRLASFPLPKVEMLRNALGYMMITGTFSVEELERKVLCSLLRVSTWSSALMMVDECAHLRVCDNAQVCVNTCGGGCAPFLHLLSDVFSFQLLSVCDHLPTQLASWPAGNHVEVKLVGRCSLGLFLFLPSLALFFSFIASISSFCSFCWLTCKTP